MFWMVCWCVWALKILLYLLADVQLWGAVCCWALWLRCSPAPKPPACAADAAWHCGTPGPSPRSASSAVTHHHHIIVITAKASTAVINSIIPLICTAVTLSSQQRRHHKVKRDASSLHLHLCTYITVLQLLRPRAHFLLISFFFLKLQLIKMWKPRLYNSGKIELKWWFFTALQQFSHDAHSSPLVFRGK